MKAHPRRDFVWHFGYNRRKPVCSDSSLRCIRILCQLSQVREKVLGLADEKPHVGEELQGTHGGAFRLGWPDD